MINTTAKNDPFWHLLDVFSWVSRPQPKNKLVAKFSTTILRKQSVLSDKNIIFHENGLF